MRLADCFGCTDLSGLEAPNVDPEGLEGAGVALSLSPGEYVDRGHQFHVNETGLLYGVQILSLQESAPDSSGPQIYIRFGAVRHWPMNHHVAQK